MAKSKKIKGTKSDDNIQGTGGVDKIDARVVRGRFQVAHGRPTYDGSSLRRLS